MLRGCGCFRLKCKVYGVPWVGRYRLGIPYVSIFHSASVLFDLLGKSNTGVALSCWAGRLGADFASDVLLSLLSSWSLVGALLLQPCYLREGVFGTVAERVRCTAAYAGDYVKENPCCTSCSKWDKLISPKLQPRGL